MTLVRPLLLLVAVALSVLAAVVLVNAFLLTASPLDVRPVGVVRAGRPGEAERLAGAIRFTTVSHQDPARHSPEGFLKFHAFLEASFPRVHRALTREVVNGASLLYTWKGTNPGADAVLLLAHQDVVPVDPATEGEWQHPPFSGRIAGGFVWGRGALDHKGSLLAILEAVESLLAQRFRPARTVYLAFGHDEEVGGLQGAAKMAAVLRSRGVTLDFVVDEGLPVGHGLISGVSVPVALVGIAEKGLLILELSVQSAGGHASMPPPHTAIGILSMAIDKLEATPMPAAIALPVRQMFMAIGPTMPFSSRLIVANLWLFDPLVARQLAGAPRTNALVRTTAAVTVIRAGIKDNALPTDARALVNFRILPGNTVAGVVDHVRRVVGDARVGIRSLRVTEPSAVADTRAPSYRTLTTTIRQVFPDAIVAPALSIVRTDSEHYLPISRAAYRFLPVRLRPEDLPRIHGANERVAIADYLAMIDFYVQLLRNSAP